MTVRDVLCGLHPTRSVVILNTDDFLLEEGVAGGLLDASAFLDSSVYCENDFPYLIVVGVTV